MCKLSNETVTKESQQDITSHYKALSASACHQACKPPIAETIVLTEARTVHHELMPVQTQYLTLTPEDLSLLLKYCLFVQLK